jgi:hypothetical protein
MAKKGFKAVALNDSFDEPPRRHREEEEEEEEENDDDINNNESEATPSSTATKNNNNDEFVTPMTTFHSTKTNTNNNNTKTTTTFIGVGSNEKIVGSNESSPNSATRQSMESRDTISELPQTPKRDLMYFQRGGGEDFRHQHNRSISATSMDGLISRLDEESGSGGGERTSVRFNEFSDAFGGRLGARESAAATTNNAFVRACSKALDIPWCFGETRRTRKNVVATVVVLLLILFAAIPLRHWKHMSR